MEGRNHARLVYIVYFILTTCFDTIQLSSGQKYEVHKHTINIVINPLSVKLNPICRLLALLGARPILHVSRVRVKGCS